ncbi:hypothetical protein [Paraburkholderia tagetis]|uniref:Uncharacterized protein n=1 Tax=Paraburkholderia tagetis TaxID=2913261 RepID=A0A9X1RV86_9BURK|nr:hypothetical protein [Paraburkholderia tagetis]MCG5077114.1 hypothetical protein [Paraburkholderia tagetis]
MDPKTNPKPIPNRVTAKAVHTRMRANHASHYELGLFYQAMLKRRLWSSQRDLAESLGVSRPNISKAVALTRIPMEVVHAVGGPEQISFRMGALLLDAIDKIGEAPFIRRVREAVRVGYAALDDILEFAVFDRIPRRTPSKIQVRLARNKKSLHVDIPDLEDLLPHLPRLEMFISSSFIIFKATLAAENAAAADSALRLLRTKTPGPRNGPRRDVKPRRQGPDGSADVG